MNKYTKKLMHIRMMLNTLLVLKYIKMALLQEV